MDRIPFSLYDWFGYLSSGGAIIFALGPLVGLPDFFSDTPAGFAEIAALIVGAYFVGHANAHVAQYALETLFVANVYRMPEHYLLGSGLITSMR